MMFKDKYSHYFVIPFLFTFILSMSMAHADAAIYGLSGTTTFNFTAKDGHISTGDGNSVYIWGYANNGGTVQYPGPTLIVNEGDTVTVNLANELSVPVSIVFPGMEIATATGGVPGEITREAAPNGGTVQYAFIAANPGTYTYYSGTNPDLQVEMGLVGVLIVRPAGFNPAAPKAYNHDDSSYDREYLFLLSEMDLKIHELVELGSISQVDTTAFWPVYWFINGRTAPDILQERNVSWLRTQPYNCIPRMHPGEKVLLRVIGGGRDLHPLHTHGNHARVIAVDGKLLQSAPSAGADLSYLLFTITSAPGQTVDAIYTWTGENLGWDVYGHQQDIDNVPTGNFPGAEDIDHNKNGIFDSVPPVPGEDIDDHGKPIPVVLPDITTLTLGPFYSGSPYLGTMGALPPGEGGFNPYAGFFFMWHSHNENEIVNNDIFPGGMMTMGIIEHPDVPIIE